MRFKIGDKLWYVYENRGPTTQIRMVDENGVEWYRNTPRKSIFAIIEATIVGTFEAIVEGENSLWDEWEDNLLQYAVRYTDETGENFLDRVYDVTIDDEFPNYGMYFSSEELAKKYVEERINAS